MFGFLTAAVQLMTEQQQERYKACYCGLCRSLKACHGQISRLTLNYDMTFLVLLLESLYEPAEKTGENRCAVHPFKPRRWQRSEISDYAADMNLALAYLKLRDDWDDDADPAALAESAVIKREYKKTAEKYPRQCGVMKSSIEELSRIEKTGEEEPDACAACFGRLMAEVFVYREDHWSGTLRAMGDALGRFIYVLDACIDLDRDVYLCRYNPFSSRKGREDNEEYFRDILRMLLGECVMHFDRLPLIQDTDILKNILCFGLWAEFEKKYNKSKGKGPSDVSGPV